ncbi:ABC transporter permease [Aliibacillus thermotolerans]|uniref:ABC transporter permease n=1 Tax=Aliibacillus thermotolerans TaxID=1834418 RepID=A0ABW0U4Q4_9BACI|nr:ABC transporter permease [Aliibacillus thermotolerans]MDA3128508.1 ABC transporter permease subunit [Aliibacillus thermotolerans]
MWSVTKQEWKLNTRLPWVYFFLVTYTLFVYFFSSLHADSALGLGLYTNMTGTMMNITIYFLPLFTLMIASFSVTTEKEDGRLNLYFISPAPLCHWIVGKWFGLFGVLGAVILISFSFASIIALFMKIDVTVNNMYLLFFSLSLLAMFLSLGICIGTFVKNRWQALTVSVIVWGFFILLWPMFLMTVLSSFRYQTIVTALEISTFINPVEWLRIFVISNMGGGVIFGAEYTDWITWTEGGTGVIIFILALAGWIILPLLFSSMYLKRRRTYGEK